MTNLDSIFKSRDITLPTKVRLVKAMAFPVVMYGCKSSAIKKAFPVVIYGCESGTIKKAEHIRIAAFELCCWIIFKTDFL